MENQIKVSPLRQSSSTCQFMSKISGQRTMWPHWSIPHTLLLGSSWILPVTSTEISIEEIVLLWRYCKHHECDRRAVKVFTKWLWGMFPTNLQSLAEVYCCTRGIFWRKF